MQAGIDSSSDRLRKLVEQIEYADKLGWICLVLENITVKNGMLEFK